MIRRFAALIFFHPDCTVGPGVTPSQRLREPVADYTASRGIAPHPEDKVFSCFLGRIVAQYPVNCKYFVKKEKGAVSKYEL